MDDTTLLLPDLALYIDFRAEVIIFLLDQVIYAIYEQLRVSKCVRRFFLILEAYEPTR